MASIKYLVDLDLSKNQLLNAVVQNLESAPTSPVEGQIYWDTVDKVIYIQDSTYAQNSGWRVMGTDDQIASEVNFTPASSDTRITSTNVQNALEKVELYTTSLSNSLEIPNNVGGIEAGSVVSDYKDKPISEILDDLLFPTVDASIATNASVSIAGSTTSTTEVGTSITQDITVTLNRGSVINGDGSSPSTPQLVGSMSNVTLTDPTNNPTSIILATSPQNITSSSEHTITLGDNEWDVDVINAVGNPNYEDNKGGTDAVASIDAASAVTARPTQNINISGRYYRFHYLGARNTHPTASAGIRALTKAFTSTSNTGSYTLSVPASTSEVVLYIIQNKNLAVKDINTNADMVAGVSPSTIAVKDGSGTTDVNYDKYVIDLGLNGFPNATSFQITIS